MPLLRSLIPMCPRNFTPHFLCLPSSTFLRVEDTYRIGSCTSTGAETGINRNNVACTDGSIDRLRLVLRHVKIHKSNGFYFCFAWITPLGELADGTVGECRNHRRTVIGRELQGRSCRDHASTAGQSARAFDNETFFISTLSGDL